MKPELLGLIPLPTLVALRTDPRWTGFECELNVIRPGLCRCWRNKKCFRSIVFHLSRGKRVWPVLYWIAFLSYPFRLC